MIQGPVWNTRVPYDPDVEHPGLWFTDYSQDAIRGLLYKYAIFGAGKSPGRF